ncbi:hypothetical protein ACFOY4_08725 [Actinomadura syzygii]|uniref:Uncharacterized protein n=1 Tax=Actinomadura syzygii TaxID=1427538 RepID=A0A5D0UDE0_9ACTN|nr:hypothetical protein [Actinomadura syzygii]TYC16074.1 hypothetical protein FXF65_12195 [Actinomadura syzygii]
MTGPTPRTTAPPEKPATRVLGVDTGTRTLLEAEHLIRDLVTALGLQDGATACTHFIRDGHPHVAVSLDVPADADLGALPDDAGVSFDSRRGPSDLAGSAAVAAGEHAARRSGRAVLFPGAERLTGTLTVGDVLELSAIERIRVLATPEPPASETVLDTRGHVRPEWADGVLVLAAMPAAGGVLVPFEVPNPTPCCADHA